MLSAYWCLLLKMCMIDDLIADFEYMHDNIFKENELDSKYVKWKENEISKVIICLCICV